MTRAGASPDDSSTEAEGAPPDEAPSQDQRIAERRRALRVGTAVLVSIAILVGLLLITGPLVGVRGPAVRIDFTFAGPIKPGAAVRVSGVEVGVVQRVELLAGRDAHAGADKMVRLHARVEERARAVLTTRARFRVTTLGVLGEHYLDVEPVQGGVPLEDGARVEGESLARADLLLARAAGLLERADALLSSSPEALALMRALSSLATQLDAMLGQEASAEALREARALMADLRTTLRSAAVGLGDGAALKRSIESLPTVLDKTARLEDAALSAEILPTLGPMLRDARGTLTKLDRTLELVAQAPLLEPGQQDALRRDVTAAMRAIDAVSTRAARLLHVVEQGKGGAGKLFWDEAAAGDLRAILHALRENPVRFLLGRDAP